MHIYEHCTILQDYMSQTGDNTWSAVNRFRVYYKGIPVLSINHMPDNTFQIVDSMGKVHKNISGYIDEIVYVDEITVRQKHIGVKSIRPNV